MTGPQRRAEGAPGAIAGFTLLEVLAAALIFSLVVTVLIGTSSSAVHMSGVSASRLEANAIAEQELARLEAVLNVQGPPPEDREETGERFSIRVWAEPAIDDFGGGLVADTDAPASGVAAILALEAPGIENFLLRYEIRVEWIEGAQPETIRRTTYAFDWVGARAALPELFQGAAEGDLGVEDGGAGDLPPGLELPQREAE